MNCWHRDSPVRKAIYAEAVAKAQKSRPDLFPSKAMLLSGDVLAFGDKKHPGAPWLKMTIADHLAASQRHYLQWQTGDTVDSESGKSHLAHALVRLAMAVELEATS